MNSLQTIMRKDFIDSLRSRSIWVAFGFMSVLILSSYWGYVSSPLLQQIDRPFLVAVGQFSLWLPLVAITIGYKSVVGERESGSIRVLLGQPGTRRDVVFGTFLGRLMVLGVSILASVVLVTPLVFWSTGKLTVITFVGGVVALLLYGAAWIGMTVGVSSCTTTESQALGILIGIYALVDVLWQQVVVPLLSLAFTGIKSPPVDPSAVLLTLTEPTWYIYLIRLSPSRSFVAARMYIPNLLEMFLLGNPITAPHAPNLFGIAVLLVWATVPIGLGYWLFERAELT